ncbi:MAG TPA: dihydrofolate reductase family protein [Terriglobales bacterium]|nr:dihydrofolate reductase family protein [Terriglobales bacterium]
MREFQVLFDDGEPSSIESDVLRPYGRLGFPAPPEGRPWIYANFVQSMDGITSLLGRHGSGGDISQSSEDRWLMDVLRAHADAVIMGLNTLVHERVYMGNPRGPVFRIANAEVQELRKILGRVKFKNVFVTNSANLELADFRVFDSEEVDAFVVTTTAGASRLRAQRHPMVTIIESGEWPRVDLQRMVRLLREQLGIRYLLCEGGPTFYGSMAKAGLIDEKFVTVAPVEVGQAAPPEQEMAEFDKTRLRPNTFTGPGFTKEKMSRWKWLSCRKAGDHEFNRYRLLRNL